MAVSSSAGTSKLELSIAQYVSLLDKLAEERANSNEIYRDLLLVRDRLARLFRTSSSVAPALVTTLAALDQRLQRTRKSLKLDDSEFDNLRSLEDPPKRNWWWYPPDPNPAWTIGALFLLTISISILTDFTRRLLNSGPDEIGLLSIAVQGLFAVGATSTFTKTGRQGLESVFSSLGIAGHYRPAMKLSATLALFIVVFCAWKFLPSRLADYYSDVAFRQQSSSPDAARVNYARAISLNPANVRAHFNLGALYENAYEYDKAAAEYRRTLVIEPNHIRAYSNLSRLLLRGSDSSGALQVADDALKLQVNEGQEITAALYRNRALAEYGIGLYEQAEADAKQSSNAQSTAADPYCVLAKIYTKQGRAAEAGKAWQKFLARINNHVLQPRLEPDCIHLAAEASHESH